MKGTGPRSYRSHVDEQLRNEPSAAYGVRAGISDDSVFGRYLSSSSRIEREAAGEIVTQVRGGSEEEALATVVKDRRGSAVDVGLSLASSGVGYVLGKAADQISPSPIVAAIPGAVAIAAGFLLKVPYPARTGLAHFGASWLMGGRSNKKEP